MAENWCVRRRRLYQRQIYDTEKFLANVLENGVFTSQDKPLLEEALKDSRLLDRLEEFLIPYAVYGVEKDLRRLDKSKALFCDSTDGRYPALSDVLPLEGSSPQSLPAGFKIVSSVTPELAYTRYFDWYINPADVGGGKTGVDAFFERYPLLDNAVRTVTTHYQDNIQLACERVAADWRDINKAFFPGRKLGKLSEIQTTGNDFHKGGKQVLILTFDLDQGSGRVVYKPSAVEIDCRIVGDSRVFQRVSPQGPKDDTGYTQHASLTELINQSNPEHDVPEGFRSRLLPTYRILPYNRDSVPDSYGYIEFLTHLPELEVRIASRDDMGGKVGEAVQKLGADAVTSSDWIIEDPEDGLLFYYQFGALMAMAMAVSLSDLHVQNVIAHGRRPYLIDLEEALKTPMTSVQSTMLSGVLDQVEDPGAVPLIIRNDQTSSLRARWETSRYERPPVPAASILYLSHGNAAPAEPVTLAGSPAIGGQGNRKALNRGFVDVVEALATAACNDAVKAWAGGLGNTIARYVTRKTADYAANCRDLYQLYCDSSIKTGAPNDAYDKVKFVPEGGTDQFFFRKAVQLQRDNWQKSWNTTWNGLTAAQKIGRWPIAPYFSAEHPDHAWRDYLNCDIPSFYHLLGSPDLLNSKGDKVDVVKVNDWQERNITDPGDLPKNWQSNPDGAYLPQKPTDMVVGQLDRLKQAWGQEGDAKKAFLDQAVEGTNLAGGFQGLSLGRAGQRQPAGPGTQSQGGGS